MAADAGRKLWKAAEKRNLGECRRLLTEAVPVDSVGGCWEQTALGVAAVEGYADVAQILLDNGARVDKTDKHGRTPLLLAVLNARPAVVVLLLDYGASVNKVSGHGDAPLFAAARQGDDGTVASLLDSGAWANASNEDGRRTALSSAATYGHVACVHVLLAATEMRRHFA